MRLTARSIFLTFCSILALVCVSCNGDGGSGSASTSSGGGVELASPYLALDGSQAMVFNFNLTKMRRLAIYKELRQLLLEDSERKSMWDDLVSNIGMDPLDKFETVVVGFGKPFDADLPIKNSVFIFSAKAGTFPDEDEMVKGWLSFLDGRYMDGVPNPTTDTFEGFKTWSVMRIPMVDQPEKSMDMHIAFINNGTMVAASTLENLHSTLSVAKGKKTSIGQHPEWTGHLSRAVFAAVVWGVGEIPDSVNEKIAEARKTESELKGLIFLDRGEDFAMNFNYDGSEYTLAASVGTSEFRYAGGIKNQLTTAMGRGYPQRKMNEWMPEHPGRVKVLSEMFTQFLISVDGERTSVLYRMEKTQFHEYIERVLNPPKLASPQDVKPQATVVDPFDL